MKTVKFKQKYPLHYQKLLNLYDNENGMINDKEAAIHLFLNNMPHPSCAICRKKLHITKKFRNNKRIDCRCSEHINVGKIYTYSEILSKNIYNYKIVSINSDIILGSSLITLCCEEHNSIYTQTISNFMKGMQCQKCYHGKKGSRITLDEWINKCKSVHENKYDYSKVKYNSMSDVVKIICPEHGIFTQNAGTHSRGHGCKHCANSEIMLHDDFLEKAVALHGDAYNYDMANYDGARNKISIMCKQHGKFEQIAYYHLAGSGCPACGLAKTSNKSKAEYELLDFLKSNNIKTIHSYRKLGFEIDIMLPDYQVAIEYNGAYWHSSINKNTDKKLSEQHLYKTEKCEDSGIQLLHILDLEWNDPDKREIWKSLILNKCKLTQTRIFARKTTVVELSTSEAKEFFNRTHLQGFCAASKYIGLIYNKKLVCAMSISKARYNKYSEFEIIRMSSELHTIVVGGGSKLLSYLGKGTFVSYANRRWSTGNVYDKLGFNLVYITKPCYYYTNSRKLWHRSSFMKHKLDKKLKSFDPELTEYENMYNNNYRRLWDCGNLVYWRMA